MKSATHNGTCQICGRHQAFAKYVIAKHGYTVEHGYFQGTCPGSGHQPLEFDRTFADEVAASLRRDAAMQAIKVARINAGKLFPEQAKNGEQEQYERMTSFGPRKSWRAVMVPYAQAPNHHQRDAVNECRFNCERQRDLAASTAKGIVMNADRITGKQCLTPRSSNADKKVIAAGTVVKLGGKDGVTVTVLRVENRTAWGCGPHLNGNVMPHIVFERNGKERYYPVRLIRQASIVS